MEARGEGSKLHQLSEEEAAVRAWNHFVACLRAAKQGWEMMQETKVQADIESLSGNVQTYLSLECTEMTFEDGLDFLMPIWQANGGIETMFSEEMEAEDGK